MRRPDDSIRRLVDDLIESMVAAQGVGLAAPQIGVGLRVVVIGMPDEEPFALLNPVVGEALPGSAAWRARAASPCPATAAR